MMQTSFLFALFLVAVLGLAAANKNPCHDNKGAQGSGVTCEKVRLPAKLCSACKLKPPGPGGNFVNCKAIYDLDDPACRAALTNYSLMNRHCDPVRANQVKNFNSSSNKQGLDYFVYSVCEECCDCIPIGATSGQYNMRKMQGTLLSSHRGNCPAHAVYDICQIWPEVKFVSGLGSRDQFWRPRICPLLQQWLNSPQSQNWLSQSFVPMNPHIKYFLDRFGRVARCRNPSTWQRCHNLEDQQNRL